MSVKKLFKIIPVRSFGTKNEETSSIWNLFNNKKETKKKQPTPPKESCKKRQDGGRCDPDLSRFGGDPYRTCGTAYVIQKDMIPVYDSPQSAEERILRKIEADPGIKDNVDDPMPPFRSVEQRMLDLTDRKLHPFYRMYMAMGRKERREEEKGKNLQKQKEDRGHVPYKCKTGPLEPNEIPDVFKYNKDLLDKKNIFADFKMVELPKQLVVRMVEMEKNRRPTLERKKEEEKPKKK